MRRKSNRFGFDNPHALDRVIKGTRAIENVIKSAPRSLDPWFGPQTGPPSVTVKIINKIVSSDPPAECTDQPDPELECLSELGYYNAVFSYRNPKSESSSDDWFDDEEDVCLAIPLNNNAVFEGDVPEELVIDKRYKGTVTGDRNGKPVVTVTAPIGDGSSGDDDHCVGANWVVDKQALIDGNADVPKRVLEYDVRAPLDPDNRCFCIPNQFNALADPPFDGVAQAVWDAGVGAWVGTRLIHSCCSCGQIKIMLPNNDGTADTWPPISAILTMNATCDATSPKTYMLRYKCETRTTVIFRAAGPKLCTGTATPVECDNAFEIAIRCATCAIPTVDCDQCTELCAPSIWRIVVSTFANEWTVYNGIWDLVSVGDCEWEVSCGTTTVNMTLTPTGTNDTTQITVTFSGGSGAGTAIYRYNEPEVIAGQGANTACFGAHNIPWESGDNPDNPDEITVTPIFCVACDDFCSGIDFENMSAAVLSFTGNCNIGLALASFVAGASATFGLDGPDNDVQVHVRCSGGRLRLDISGSAFQSFTEISLSRDPFEWTVEIGFAGTGFDPCGGTAIVVFTAPTLP